MAKSSDFLKRLLTTFKVEAQEHINVLSAGLVDLEKASTPERHGEIVEVIFREAHSLKGAARAVNLTEVETVCQSLEGVFAALKRREIPTSSALFDLLHQTVDRLAHLLSPPDAAQTPAESSRLRELLQQLEHVSKGTLPSPQLEHASTERSPEEAERPDEEGRIEPPLPPSEMAVDLRPTPESTPAETVRISTSKLDALLLQVEELLSAKLSSGQLTVDLREVTAMLASWKKEWAKILPNVRMVRQSLEKDGWGNGKRRMEEWKNGRMEEWKNGRMEERKNGRAEEQESSVKFLEFLEWSSGFVTSLEDRLSTLTTVAEHDHRSLGGMVDTLLTDMKQVLMLPFSSCLDIFPRFVRDLCRDQGKEADLVLTGGELEVDRRILEEMKDPFIHLVRNCIDHGIERPEERERKGKPSRGTITIATSQKNGNKVEILIADDGAGIDVAGVRAVALKRGLVSSEDVERLTGHEAVSLIFRSGVSTSPIITDISGRGLGLAIVREKVEKLGGVVSVETAPDAGTTFRLLLPLTLATFRGVLVRADDRPFALPTVNVERVLRVSRSEIRTVENRETIQLNDLILSLVSLGDVLELPRKGIVPDAADTDRVPVVVLAFAGKRLGFLVDEILHEQEVLVKPLGKHLSRVRNVAGATVLGTGKVVPILNVSDLMDSAVKASATPGKPVVLPVEGEMMEKRSVLVVEDSITARTLLKNILETAGYEVATAVDGIDAFTQLRSGEFDLVVSDVDMPRMNGLDLTARIRADKRLAEIPVVLVTALESREDRERGIDVGANAYIVKSSFDQSNLLEVVRRLV